MLIFSKRIKILTRVVIAGFCLLLATDLVADERILDYHSDIKILSDGQIIVTENIRVRAEGQNIQRGIYRDFPTRYKDRLGNHYKVSLEVMEVLRNGSSEPFHTAGQSNGVRIYIGSKNRTLSPGVHDYRLRYSTNRQLGFFADYDELYWNVTGNGWSLPIDRASVSIELPVTIRSEDLRTAFYTGYQGENGSDAALESGNSGAIRFVSTRPLAPNEGLTVAVGWPKGVVEQPGLAQKVSWFLSDNRAALILLLGLLAPLAWYGWAWNRYGRDPAKGVIIPRFEPPQSLTPAACSYILNMSFNKQAYSAAIVNLGVRGYLEISDDGNDFELQLINRSGDGGASKGEKALLDALFEDQDRQKLEQKNHRVFISAQTGLKKALKAEHLGRLFNLNSRFALPAVAMSIIAAIIAAQFSGGPAVWVAYGLFTVVLHSMFLLLLRAPTPAGRQIMDEIEGFKMYLDTAEQDRLNRMQSPQMTPEVFESFLPYAYALGVENSWCQRFTREFPIDPETKRGYQPGWYSGPHSGMSTLNHLGNNFSSSFSSAIASASSPPGSSSGSGGGGSSGGGGGGGGGGGW